MSLKAGRVGVNPADVDPIDGHISPSSVDGYTKQEADAKFSTKDELRIAINDVDLLMGSKLNNVYGVMGENGAKNWYSSNNGQIVTENGATYELSSTGVRVYTTANKSYGNIQIPQILNKNTAFIVTGALDWVSGVARMQVRGSNDGSTWTAIAESSDYTVDGKVELSFNSGNYDYYRLRIWCTRNTAEIGDITLSNLMIRLASDPDDTYVPYAMTNRELTENKLNISDLKSITADANDFAAFKTAIANL